MDRGYVRQFKAITASLSSSCSVDFPVSFLLLSCRGKKMKEKRKISSEHRPTVMVCTFECSFLMQEKGYSMSTLRFVQANQDSVRVATQMLWVFFRLLLLISFCYFLHERSIETFLPIFNEMQWMNIPGPCFSILMSLWPVCMKLLFSRMGRSLCRDSL